MRAEPGKRPRGQRWERRGEHARRQQRPGAFEGHRPPVDRGGPRLRRGRLERDLGKLPEAAGIPEQDRNRTDPAGSGGGAAYRQTVRPCDSIDIAGGTAGGDRRRRENVGGVHRGRRAGATAEREDLGVRCRHARRGERDPQEATGDAAQVNLLRFQIQPPTMQPHFASAGSVVNGC